MRAESGSTPPTWALALAGGLLTAWLAQGFASGFAARDRAPAAGEEPRPIALAQAGARDLRRVPGLGETRALALVEARWERGNGDPPLFLADVPGVGPISAQIVRAWLAARAGSGGGAAP